MSDPFLRPKRIALIAAAFLIAAIGSQGPRIARAQTTDPSAGAIQDQPLPPPPNADENKLLGIGTSNNAASSGTISPPTVPPAPEPPSSGTASAPAPTEWLAKSQAQLIVLDKIYSSARTLSAAVGTPFSVRFLTVTVLACWIRPPNVPPDAAVFLQVIDSHAPAGSPPEFRGWIFQAEPALSGMSDPATDISVKGCS